MKLRILDASLRLRLSQTEVAQMAETGRVEGVVPFGPGSDLRYALMADSEAESIRASFREGTLTVALPAEWVAEWAEGPRVGFDATQDVGGGQTLAILVEKDFACLHEDRDEPDAFPNPHA